MVERCRAESGNRPCTPYRAEECLSLIHISAMISAIGANRGAKRTAFVHLYFKMCIRDRRVPVRKRGSGNERDWICQLPRRNKMETRQRLIWYPVSYTHLLLFPAKRIFCLCPGTQGTRIFRPDCCGWRKSSYRGL